MLQNFVHMQFEMYKNLKQSHYRPAVAQRVIGS